MLNAEMGLSDISECEWPCFLYPRSTKYDLEDNHDGLFWGYLLPMVCLMLIYADFMQIYCQIFTGPRTAMQPGAGRKGHASKSWMHNLTQISPRTIAYTCIMVSLTLNLLDLSSHIYFYFQNRITLWGKGWTIDDGTFKYPIFYQNIVRMFKMDLEDEWVQETLAWWHEYTFFFY